MAVIGKTGAEVIYNFIKSKSIKTVFGYTGGAILPLTDKFHEYHNSSIQYIKNINELCVGHAAEGYARVTKKPGIIITTSGPGVTNLITPLQNALSDGTPLIAIAGQVQTNMIGYDAFQEAPSIELTKACTKWNHRVEDVNDLPNILNKAYNKSITGRPGPIFLDLPKNILNDTITKSVPPPPHKNNDIQIYKLDKTDAFLELLYKSKKPVLYLGQGCLNSHFLIKELIGRTSIPFTTTIHAMGVCSEHNPHSLHMLGMHGSIYANKSIQESDLIIAIGSRFDDRTTGNLDYYAPEARKAEAEGRGGIIHFDIEKKQIGKTVKPTLSFLGDCKIYLHKILQNIQEDKINISDWNLKVKNLKKEKPFTYIETNEIKVQDVIKAIDTNVGHLSPYITTGVGNHQMYCAQYFRWRDPGRIITSGSLGTMGFGLPSAIGAQLAKPKEKVILIDGDGSFGMTMNDLSTVSLYKLPIKMFIMNDNRQQMVYIWQKLFFKEKYISTTNHNPDFSKIAAAYGIKYVCIDDQHNIQSVLDEIFRYKGPVLVDCIVKPDMCTPLVAPGAALDEMIDVDSDIEIMSSALAPN